MNAISDIHKSAVVDPSAKLGRNVRIGPFCHVGPDVALGDDCALHSHVTLMGPSEFGPANIFFPQCVIGAAPQDLKYKGGATRLVVGRGNTFREFVTVHRGTEVDRHSGATTRIGDFNHIMVNVHVAHDVNIGNHCVIANGAQVAGHCIIEDYVNIGGLSGVQHFATVGRYAFIAAMTRVASDIPPYVIARGKGAEVHALNVKGLQRWKFPPASLKALLQAFRLIYRGRGDGVTETIKALDAIEAGPLILDEHVRNLVAALRRKQSGVYGRDRERHRSDSAADRAGFYERSGAEAHS